MPSQITIKYNALIAAAEDLAGEFNDPDPNYPEEVSTPEEDWDDDENSIEDAEKENRALQMLTYLKRPKRLVGYV